MSAQEIGFAQFARLVLDALVAADVEYLIGGSVALWAWGESRTTLDFDLVVKLPFEQVYALSRELTNRNMLVSPEVIVDLLLQSEGDLPINAIHMDSNFKAELFLLRPRDTFRENALARRRLVDLGSPLGHVYDHAPEDLILNKVHYFSISQQTKHVRDIAGIIAYSHDLIDFEYLNQWAELIGLSDSWGAMQSYVDELLANDE